MAIRWAGAGAHTALTIQLMLTRDGATHPQTRMWNIPDSKPNQKLKVAPSVKPMSRLQNGSRQTEGGRHHAQSLFRV